MDSEVLDSIDYNIIQVKFQWTIQNGIDLKYVVDDWENYLLMNFYAVWRSYVELNIDYTTILTTFEVPFYSFFALMLYGLSIKIH